MKHSLFKKIIILFFFLPTYLVPTQFFQTVIGNKHFLGLVDADLDMCPGSIIDIEERPIYLNHMPGRPLNELHGHRD